MTPAETIAAAIEKLEHLKAGSTPGHWTFETEPFGAIFSEQEPGLGVETEVAEEMTEFDGTLVIVLHRTIDAQLAILRKQFTLAERGHTGKTIDLDLARAILGEVA